MSSSSSAARQVTGRRFTGRSFAAGLAASTAAVAAFFVAALAPRAIEPLTDPDVWWHIRAGQEVLDTGAVPRVDTWSIAGLGQPWTSQDWLANVILAIGNGLGPWGQTALSVLFGLVTIASFVVLWKAMAIRVPAIGWASRVAWLSLGLLLAGPVLGVRVQVIDLLGATIVVLVCWRYVARPSRLLLVALPVLAAIWANLHAGWVLLFLLGGAVMVGEAVDRLLKREAADGPPLSWRHIAELGVALVASLAALALNPNGLELYRYPLMTLEITGLRRYVLEWHPASLDTLFGQLLAGFVVVAVLPTLILGRHRMRASDALILVGLTVMSVTAIRFLLVTGPIGAAIACVILSPLVSASTFGRGWSPALDRLGRPRGGAAGRVAIVLVGLVVALGVGVTALRVVPPSQARAIAEVMPVEAVRWLNENDAGSRIFNKHEWGGYIGLNRPDLPIFIDGRADVYGDETLETYVSVIGVQGDPQDVFDAYDIDHVIFPPETPLADWLDASDQWERAYSDDVAVVWLHR